MSTLGLSDFLATERGLYGLPPKGLGRLDARLKVGLATLAIVSNVILARLGLSVALVLLAWAGLLTSRIRWRQALLFILTPAWATLLVMVGYALSFGVTPLAHLGPLTVYREGVVLGVNAAFRVLAEMSWVAALILTTPFTDLLEALRWYHLPPVLVDTLGSMYRYIFLLFDEYQVMAASAKARGGFMSYRQTLSTLGQIAAQGFMRAMERAERIDQAMRARGRDTDPTPGQGRDVLALAPTVDSGTSHA
ncbi:MAG TPA: cobalt ECF transporter T component CbiQ [bacterium]|jgi:cobalt ECF transporter T component CbiQ|nr:cobalt ECF transporter T component CbiQ [bacterium]